MNRRDTGARIADGSFSGAEGAVTDETRSAAPAIRPGQPENPGRFGSGGVIDLLFAALALVSALPAVLVQFPESVDYLNHLARLFVLTAPADHPVHGLYRVDWHLMPNLALDLLGVALAPVLPVELVMKLAWMLCVPGMAAAVWFLHRSVHGRSEPTLLLASLCLLSLPLTFGFLGFVLALAAALAAVGLWFRMGDRATLRTLLVLNVVSAVIVVLHVAAAAALAFTIVSLHGLRPPCGPRAILQRGAIAATGFLAPLALLLVMERAPADPSMPGVWSSLVYSLAAKPALLTELLFTGDPRTMLVGAAALAVGLGLVLCPPGGGWSRRLAPTLIAWVLLLLALPQEIGRATVIDRRLIVFPVLLFLGTLSAGAMSPLRRRMAAALVVAVVALRSGALIPQWRDYNEQVAAFRVMARAVEPGAKVLVGRLPPTQRDRCDEPPRWPEFFYHVPSLLVIDRTAFVPMLFAAPGMQPIRVTDAYQAIAEPGALIVPWAKLLAADTQAGRAELLAAARLSVWRQPYFLDWRRSYDYLLLVALDCADPIPADSRLTPVGDSGVYRLYRIEHGR